MEFDLRRYLRLVMKWWWLLAIGAVIPVVVSNHFVSQRPSIYQARVVLMVGTTLQSPNPSAGDISLSERLARGYAEMVLYRPVTDEVIRRLGLERSPGQLAAQITAFVGRGSNLLEIRVADVNPQAAATIANALADELIRQSPAAQTEGEQQRFVEGQLGKLKAKIEQMERDIEEQTAMLDSLTSAAEIQSAQENLASLESVLSHYRAEHAAYLQSYVGRSINQLTVVEPALVPGSPMGGRKILVLGVAGLAGVGLALAGVFLIEYMDDTLQWGESQEETLFGLPVLGALGRMSTRPEAITARLLQRSPEADALRALRTAVLLERIRRPYQTLLVTSPSGEEGKSFTTANLSVSIAAAGLRVIVVDSDMYRPSLHELLDRPNVWGLTDLLQPSTPVTDIESLKGLQETDMTNLWLLSGGQVPLDPTALLMSPHFPRLVASLRQYADVVVLDGPPTLVGPDVAVLASAIDAAILVVGHGTTTRRELQRARESLETQGGARLLGMVFNHVRLRSRAYRYYYSQPRRPSWLSNVWQRLMPQRRQAKLAADDPYRLVSLAEAANRLGIDKATARRWARTGRLPVVKGGWRRRVRQVDLKRLIARVAMGRVDKPLPPGGDGRDSLAGQPSLAEELEAALDEGWVHLDAEEA